MNWYKKAQQNMTLDNIILAIDNIILKNYQFSIEDLKVAGLRLNSRDMSLSKAAQKIKESPFKVNLPTASNSHKKIMDLFYKGYSISQIASILNEKKENVGTVIKSFFPKKKDQQKELEKSKEKYLIEINKIIEHTMETLEKVVSMKTIGEQLNIPSFFVKKILDDSNISLRQVSLDRKFKLEEMIVSISNDVSVPSNKELIAEEFYQRFKRRISPTTVYLALLYRNIPSQEKENPAHIYTAFKTFMTQQTGTGFIESVQNEGYLVKKIDEFIYRYGEFFGFVEPMEKQKLKELFMTKIQIRDRSIQQKDVGMYFKDYFNPAIQQKVHNLINNDIPIPYIAKQLGLDINELKKYYQLYMIKKGPITMGEPHPSYFLTDNGEQNELV
ncbi:MAG TPA: hypothetical protein VMZ91_15210 [Candidatus Paceibacterota bacterium]|nr:hypothetical protein [Candidatus Paceibacterota bacterium]